MPNNNQFNSSYTDNKSLKDITGKELTANDFTDTLKTKLDGVQDGAQVNVRADWNATSGDSEILNKPKIPTSTLDLNDATNKRYVTDANLATISNQSGTNTGDNATNSQYSGLAASKQDTLTLTTTGTSGAATLVGATLNIPQYSGGGGSSNPSVINFSAVDGTIITGTLSETVSQSLLIPANTYTGNGLLEIVNTMTKVGIAGTSRFRIYKNTSNTLIGATLISQSAVIAASLLFANMTRIMRVNSNILTGFNTATQAFSDFNSSGAGFSTTFLTSVDNYIIFTITLGSTADNANISMARLIKTI